MNERTDTVYEAIKARAISFAFSPGQRILQGPLAEELGARRHQVREALLRLVSEGWVVQASNKGFRAITLNATTLAEYHNVNRFLLESALHAAESGQPIRKSVLDRIDKILGKLSPFEGDDESLATLIGQLFSAIAALGGNRVVMQLVQNCNEHLYYIRTRECQYLDGVAAELAGLCELAAGRHFSELQLSINEYHTRRNRLTSTQIRILSATRGATEHEQLASRYH
jgi:DNA-binding GntR family transcriptional regulator